MAKGTKRANGAASSMPPQKRSRGVQKKKNNTQNKPHPKSQNQKPVPQKSKPAPVPLSSDDDEVDPETLDHFNEYDASFLKQLDPRKLETVKKAVGVKPKLQRVVEKEQENESDEDSESHLDEAISGEDSEDENSEIDCEIHSENESAVDSEMESEIDGETDHDDIDFDSDEDIDISLDDASASENSNYSSDSEAEATPRKSSSWQTENKASRLPLKDEKGSWQKPELTSTGLESDSDSSADEEQTKKPTKKVAAVTPLLDDSNRSPKERMALLASAIIESPEKYISQLKKLREFTKTEDTKQCRLALATQLQVYLDLMPGYRLRLPTEEELAVKVSKEVQQLRQYESTLLSGYQSFIQQLLQSLQEQQKEETSVILPTVVQCLTVLLVRASHFNFHSQILEAVVQFLPKCQRRHERLLTRICESIKDLLNGDELGQSSHEAVLQLSRMLKAVHYRVPRQVMEIFLALKAPFSKLSSSTLSTTPPATRKAKQVKQHLSRQQRKNRKVDKLLEQDLKEAEAVVSQEEKSKWFSETLKLVFILYFRILKQQPVASALLPAVMQGLSQFAHLIDISYFHDLVTVLRQLCPQMQEESALESILTVFSIVTQHGELVDLDLKYFYTCLYRLLGQSNILSEHWSLIEKCLNLMFFKKSSIIAERVAAFIRRLMEQSVLMQDKTMILNVLTMVQKLFQKYPKTVSLLDREHCMGNGVYKSTIQDPDMCHALSSRMKEIDHFLGHQSKSVQWMAKQISSLADAATLGRF